MVYFIRSGPETVFIRFKNGFKTAEELFLKWGFFCGSDPEEAFSLGAESCSIVIAVAENTCTHDEEIRFYLSENSLGMFFCMMLSAEAGHEAAECQSEPDCLFMRLIGNIDEGINKIKEDWGGILINKSPFFRRKLPEKSTVIYFTQNQLNKSIPNHAIHPTALLIRNYSKWELFSALQTRQTEYLGDSMGTPDWKSMKIRIGDKEKRFGIHRKRVLAAINGLQAGLVLEEGWDREYTLIGKVVDVYVLKLYTPLGEEEVKGFLTGLEYDEFGKRIADIDLFFNDKKISWKNRRNGDDVNEAEFGLQRRENILRSLDRHSVSRMNKLNEELKISAAE